MKLGQESILKAKQNKSLQSLRIAYENKNYIRV